MPDNATNKTITWSSTAPEIASVDENGVVTAISVGHATITAKIGFFSQNCIVHVKKKVIPVSSVTLNSAELSMYEGDTGFLVATVLPDDATYPTVSWSSSNRGVVSVDSNGRLTAQSEGTADITASAGECSATCRITVIKRFIPVEKVTLNKSALTLIEGNEYSLKATISPYNASEQSIQWSSSNSDIALVSVDGRVSALSIGTATITATSGECSAECQVTVEPLIIPVSRVTLNYTSRTVAPGDAVYLEATVSPDDATYPTVSWSSSNSDVASVDENGVVFALKPGSAIITASAGDYKAKCTIIVTSIPVSSVSLNTYSLVMAVGYEVSLQASVTPENATYNHVTWTSSDTSIATVNQIGTVTAVSKGDVVITAAAESKAARCTIKVSELGLTLTPSRLSIAVGEHQVISASITPDSASGTPIAWTSSNENVATVDQNGTITGVGEGDAVITAQTGSTQAFCDVSVIIPVTSVTLNKENLTLTEGESEYLTCTVVPDNATHRNVVWTSSNKRIVSVNSDGLVTANRPGKAEIIATAGGESASCPVEVLAKVIPVTAVNISKSSAVLVEGNYLFLYAYVSPSNATDKTVTWTSSDTSVATVAQNGRVMALAPGDVVITAQSGDVSATCSIRVRPSYIPVETITLNKTSIELTETFFERLSATITPDDATDQTMTWSSSNPEVASVDQNGIVRALKEGSATITVVAGEASAQCSVLVNKLIIPIAGLSLNKDNLKLVEGKKEQLIVSVEPANATYQELFWSSSNSEIAVVNSSGEVTAIKKGSAVITVSSADGISASCLVVVVQTADGDNETIGEVIWK